MCLGLVSSLLQPSLRNSLLPSTTVLKAYWPPRADTIPVSFPVLSLSWRLWLLWSSWSKHLFHLFYHGSTLIFPVSSMVLQQNARLTAASLLPDLTHLPPTMVLPGKSTFQKVKEGQSVGEVQNQKVGEE